ncbi:hypothetical protein BV20DRAFT_148396 [Pilatotrama ljubarskyi]|nr:hypothetical protein BV20DRAFT_148396 [Pilatotrama ljubarskyi]
MEGCVAHNGGGVHLATRCSTAPYGEDVECVSLRMVVRTRAPVCAGAAKRAPSWQVLDGKEAFAALAPNSSLRGATRGIGVDLVSLGSVRPESRASDGDSSTVSRTAPADCRSPVFSASRDRRDMHHVLLHTYLGQSGVECEAWSGAERMGRTLTGFCGKRSDSTVYG